MTRVMSLANYLADTKQLLLQTLNDRASARGEEDVEIVPERPMLRVVAKREGEVLTLRRQENDDDGNQ